MRMKCKSFEEVELEVIKDQSQRRLEENVSLKNELSELYKCLYPNSEDIVKQVGEEAGLTLEGIKFLRQCDYLNIMRNYHKKQLEKEKLKKLIKECMGEIKQ